jgi:adiponectin receptor
MTENLNKKINLVKEKFFDESKHLMESIDYIKMSQFMDEIPKKLNELTEKLNKMVNNKKFSNRTKEEGHNFTEVFEYQELISRWPLFIFLSSAIICLGSSAVFHWFSAHSQKVNEMLARLDYAGISILIAGSCYPPYYYFFYCESFFRNGYLLFITILAGGVFVVSFDKEFAKPHMRKYRGLLFLSLGVSAGVPVLHLTFFGYLFF